MKLSKNKWKNYSIIVSVISLFAIGGLSFFLIQAKQEVKSLQNNDNQQQFNGQMPSGERPSDMPSGGGPGEENTSDSSTSESSE